MLFRSIVFSLCAFNQFASAPLSGDAIVDPCLCRRCAVLATAACAARAIDAAGAGVNCPVVVVDAGVVHVVAGHEHADAGACSGDESLAAAMSTEFLALLPSRTLLFPYALELLQYLTQKNYQLHLITNGFEKTQHSKLIHSGLKSFFTEVITSEGANSLKPKPEIFAHALEKAKATKQESIMIGDTLEVDILGAQGFGIDQIHVNHLSQQKESLADGSFPTYTVFSLKEIEAIL